MMNHPVKAKTLKRSSVSVCNLFCDHWQHYTTAKRCNVNGILARKKKEKTPF